MGFLGTLKNALYKMDFFYTAELLRYREEPEYRTIFGGVLSLSIIILLLVTFYNKVIDTFDKVIISSSFSAVNADDPTSYTISTMPGMPFMLGVQIWHHDLNANPRYFDVALTNVFYDTGQVNENSSVSIALEPCTKYHWSQYPKIQNNFQRLSINTWLCLPKNSQFEIYGKYASVTSKTLEISVSRCTNSSDFANPCASDSEIDQFFKVEQNFYYTAYFINPLINADSQEYLSYYLEDSNYAIFSATDGEECQLWMEDFTITTDQSIIPFTADNVKSGGIVTKNCIKNRYSIDANDTQATYSTMTIFKSPISKSIGRSFQKIDEILSYIGGLFGTIAICLFLVNVYNGYSFEVLMGGYLFKPDDDNMKKDLKKYNFFYFLVQMFYAFLSMFGSCCSWKTAKLYYECREEMTKQLDILYLYKRVVLLERGLGTLLSEQQISALHLMEKPTLNEAKKIRRKYKYNSDVFLYRIFRKNFQLFQSRENIEEANVTEKIEVTSDPNNVSNVHLIARTGEKIVYQSRNHGTNSHLKRPDFLDEFSESSDSEDEDERNETKEMLQTLAELKNDVEKEQISRRIWNKLSEDLKFVVDNASQIFKENIKEFKNDNNYVLEENIDPMRWVTRKSKMNRFKQLPTLMVPQIIKVGNGQQDTQVQKGKRKQQKNLDKFIEMQEYQHLPNKNQ